MPGFGQQVQENVTQEATDRETQQQSEIWTLFCKKGRNHEIIIIQGLRYNLKDKKVFLGSAGAVRVHQKVS